MTEVGKVQYPRIACASLDPPAAEPAGASAGADRLVWKYKLRAEYRPCRREDFMPAESESVAQASLTWKVCGWRLKEIFRGA